MLALKELKQELEQNQEFVQAYTEIQAELASMRAIVDRNNACQTEQDTEATKGKRF